MSKIRFFVLLTLFAVLSGIVQGVAKFVIVHFFALDNLSVQCVIQAICIMPVIVWAIFALRKLK